MAGESNPSLTNGRGDAGRSWWLLVALCLLAGVAGGLLGTFGWQKFAAAGRAPAADTQKMVEDAILANPQIIPDAITRLQQLEVEKLLASNRAEIEQPFAGAWAGAEDGDVVLVEFFDFNCPFCRKSAADVARLLEEDPKLKVVFRDMPVLGPESERYARASLAAAQQGPETYRRFYTEVFSGQGSLGQERLIQTVRKAGVKEASVAEAMHSTEVGAELERNLSMGRALGLTGTPSYVIGNRILSGAVGYDALKQAIADARR